MRRQKRKAQNRAAQRAFRERKERHLKDLETKVDELEKNSESTNHENGRLRAQVERLNTEVKEYRKRLSMTAPSVGLRTPAANPVPYTTYNNSSQSSDFLFAFPKFGDLPGSYFMSNGSLAKISPPATTNSVSSRASPAGVPNLARSSSSQQSPATKSPLTPISPNGMQGTNSKSQDLYQSPTTSFNGNNLDELNELFSPSGLENSRRSNSSDYMFPKNSSAVSTAPSKSTSADSYRASAHVPGFTQAVSNGSTSSPSASSMSHTGLDSSCGTTPEPSADSPQNRKISEASLNTIDEESSHINNDVQGKTSPTQNRSHPPLLPKEDCVSDTTHSTIHHDEIARGRLQRHRLVSATKRRAVRPRPLRRLPRSPGQHYEHQPRRLLQRRIPHAGLQHPLQYRRAHTVPSARPATTTNCACQARPDQAMRSSAERQRRPLCKIQTLFVM